MKTPRFATVLALLCAPVFAAEEPANFEVGAFTFARPAEWSWVAVPPAMQAMRKAQLAVPGKDNAKPAEIIFYYFGPGQGGGVKPNVDRWLGQFPEKISPEKVEEKDLGGKKVTFVSVEGTYSSGMPTGPKTPLTGYGLLGAILEHANGAVFVKMTGPAAVVKGATPRFHEFVAAAVAGK